MRSRVARLQMGIGNAGGSGTGAQLQIIRQKMKSRILQRLANGDLARANRFADQNSGEFHNRIGDRD